MEQQEPKSGFNFKEFEQQAIEQLKSGKPLEGKDGVLAPLIKRLVEASLEGIGRPFKQYRQYKPS